jgi:dTDP-4-amino-4,6-dideoxygalactose transaminase
MIRKIPSTAVPIPLSDVLNGLFCWVTKKRAIRIFEEKFARYLGVKYAFLVNSGTTAFYLIIKAFSHFSQRKEVLLPAYTVPTLCLPIWKAGLKPVLVDVSLDTFNLDPSCLEKAINKNTLCVVPTHMFGFPCDMDAIFHALTDRNLFVFEDAAQAMGAMIDSKMVGSFGDAACFSLCKGKIMSTFNGGIITTSTDKLAYIIKAEREKLPLPTLQFKLRSFLIMLIFIYAMRPWFYGLFYPLITKFKSTAVHEDFAPGNYTEFQAGTTLPQLERISSYIERRNSIGMELYNALRGYEQILLPRIIDGSYPSFNHMPVVFKDNILRKRIQKRLLEQGIDTARMYLKPIHHIYNLGYSPQPEPFPNAVSIADGLVTIPSHPFMSEKDVMRIKMTFNELL